MFSILLSHAGPMTQDDRRPPSKAEALLSVGSGDLVRPPLLSEFVNRVHASTA